jgi:hypothetical protein
VSIEKRVTMPGALRGHEQTANERARRAIYALVGAAGLGLVVLVLHLRTGPNMVSRVTVHNSTPYELTIVVSSTPTGSVTPLGIVPRQSTATISQVIDEGSTWYFHVTCSGVDAGTIVRRRTNLAQSGWQLDVGLDAAARCRAAGLVPD